MSAGVIDLEQVRRDREAAKVEYDRWRYGFARALIAEGYGLDFMDRLVASCAAEGFAVGVKTFGAAAAAMRDLLGQDGAS